VEVGTRVGPDSVVGIVETMKMMTSVYAGATGTVAEILVPNGAGVEADAVLVRIDVDQ
jgi:acetyl-CoA carboxylase biotin carboxyl carrier protein